MKKKILAALLAALMLGGAAAVTAIAADDTPAYTVDESGNITLDVEINLKGDVNQDGVVDVGDHQCLFEHLQSITAISDTYQLEIANVNEDDIVDVGDHQRLFEHLQNIDPLK